MTKKAIFSDQQIIDACNELIAKGRSVNGRAVQTLLKRGSTPYFNTAILRLRAGGFLPVDTERDPNLDAIYESIKPLLLQMTTAANRESVIELEKLSREHTEKVKSLELDKIKMEYTISLQAEQIKELISKLEKSDSETVRLDKLNDSLALKNAGLERDLGIINTRVKNYEDNAKKLNDENKNLRDGMLATNKNSAQLLLDQSSSHDRSMNQLQLEIISLKDANKTLVSENTAIKNLSQAASIQSVEMEQRLKASQAFLLEHGSFEKVNFELQQLHSKLKELKTLKDLVWNDKGEYLFETESLGWIFFIDQDIKGKAFYTGFKRGDYVVELSHRSKPFSSINDAKAFVANYIHRMVMGALHD